MSSSLVGEKEIGEAEYTLSGLRSSGVAPFLVASRGGDCVNWNKELFETSRVRGIMGTSADSASRRLRMLSDKEVNVLECFKERNRFSVGVEGDEGESLMIAP